MKSKILILSVLTSILLGCSTSGDNSVMSGDDLFIPDITNQWTSSRGTFFNFDPDKTNVNQSTFTGQEEGATDDNFNGKFKNYAVQFTFTTGNDTGVTYSGSFVKGSNPLVMKLKGSNGENLTLTQ
jgi:hypothetical protein